MYRLLPEHQRVERIAVIAEGARNEAVVRRVVHRAVEHTVQPEQPGFLVQLVLVLAAFWNLDDDRKRVFDERVVDITVMPRMHGSSVLRPIGTTAPTVNGIGAGNDHTTC